MFISIFQYFRWNLVELVSPPSLSPLTCLSWAGLGCTNIICLSHDTSMLTVILYVRVSYCTHGFAMFVAQQTDHRPSLQHENHQLYILVFVRLVWNLEACYLPTYLPIMTPVCLPTYYHTVPPYTDRPHRRYQDRISLEQVKKTP